MEVEEGAVEEAEEAVVEEAEVEVVEVEEEVEAKDELGETGTSNHKCTVDISDWSVVLNARAYMEHSDGRLGGGTITADRPR